MTFPALDRIAALARNLDEWQRQLAARTDELTDSSADGTGDSGLVTVTAAADGRIVRVRLDPRAMRLDSQTLSGDIALAATRAQDAAAARVRDLVNDIVGTPPAAGEPAPETLGHGHR